MPAFTIKQLSCDLTPVAGLSLVGHHLSRLAPVLGRIDAALPVRTGVVTSDIVRAYVGLLVQGKSDFDAIENYRGDTLHSQLHGESVDAIALIPYMLEAFIERDRGFKALRTKSTGVLR